MSVVEASAYRPIRFLLDGEVTEVAPADPSRTVLQYLREDLVRTGTKEGCAEGDCGACTVVVAELHGEEVRCRAINSCIQFVPTLDGKALFTVESLKTKDGSLHPVQQAMVDWHASQCGFCTPGFVMSLFALYQTAQAPTRAEINDALAGNLCRCTGYRPIVDAAEAMFRATPARESVGALREPLRALTPKTMLTFETAACYYCAPSTLDELAAARLAHPEARILAGGTDVGLWVTKQHRDLPALIYVGNVDAMKRIARSATHLEIGAGASLTDAADAIVGPYPEFAELLRRFASPPIRNAGTLGGNIANGSPIGDSMPPLIALGTTVALRKGAASREIALEDLYIAYQKTALEPGEFVASIRIPLPVANSAFRTYKISKRFDQDISAVCAAFRVTLRDGRIAEARVAFGGVAATPRRAPLCEKALTGAPWNKATLESAMNALDRDFAPIDDMRASAAYRTLVSRNLLQRFHIETATPGVATSVVEMSA
ncbi:MAG: xanthine dehydrogenase small subunit [Casimicrobiaceae bacterium]